MNIGLCIGVFLLGVLVGFTGLIIVTVLVISIKHDRQLTKEEWKMGLYPEQIYVVDKIWTLMIFVTSIVILVLVIVLISYR